MNETLAFTPLANAAHWLSELETGQIDESADAAILWAYELKWHAVLDHLLRQSSLPLQARRRDGEVIRFEPTTEPQGAWVATEELRRIFANPPREAIEEFERKRQQGVDEAAREEAARRAAGRYTMREAAKEIAQNARGDWRELLGRLKTSAASGELKVYRPSSTVSCKPSSPKRLLHFHYMEATWRGLNKWLKKNEPEINFRFPAPATAQANDQVSVACDASSDTAAETSQLEVIATLGSPQAAWIVEAIRIADEVALRRQSQGRRDVTAREVCDEVATILEESRAHWGKRGPRKAEGVRREALKGWVAPALASGGSGGNGGNE